MTIARYVLALFVFFYLLYGLIPTFYYKCFRKPGFLKGHERKRIILTFDDGPDSNYTGKLLALLEKNGVRASFFVVAKKAAQNPALIRRMLDGGHLVALHSLEHKSALGKGWRYIEADFKKSLEILGELGCSLRYYRPPWGHFNLASIYFAKKHRLKLLLWNVMAQDWEQDSRAQDILHRLLSRTKNGAVICLHDSGESSGGARGAPLETIEALSSFLPIMLQRGYQFALPDEDVM
ncbi:MAG: polysaccharide deacetylase family protein [Clostridia bacterium]|jgi:peptidoglycan/xylan/chitin deacetylase (PgdA/CDA1 family)|nr:polysaccharide deacetylase family protein [Clostridia bacterium]